MSKFSARVLTALALLAAGSAPAVDLKQFSPELYPGINDKTPDEIALAGIASLYPGRLVRAPQLPQTAPTRKPLQAALPNNIKYIRCYALNDLAALPADTSAIVDLRYFTTAPERASECADFCEKISGELPAVKVLGNYPAPAKTEKTPPAETKRKVFVLVNRGTAGPIEAMLADLQAREKITLAGTATAGKTAVYAPLENAPQWSKISGEIRPENPPKTLLVSGAAPDLRVAVSDANDLYAWQGVERGATPEAVLRLPKNGAGTTAAADAAKPAEGDAVEAFTGTDMTLRRAYDVLVALQVMEGMAASAR